MKTAQRKKAVIRQNPAAGDGRNPGEHCPAHGIYEPNVEARRLRNAALTPGVSPAAAQALLDEATRIRRTCPECEDMHPTLNVWAVRIRKMLRREADAVPSKCAGPTGAGITPNPCTTPGSLLRCQLCPSSPTYWRRTEP